MERVHVQLVDPGSHYEHPEGTLTHQRVIELPRDTQVKRAIQGRVLQVVPAPEAAPEAPGSPEAPSAPEAPGTAKAPKRPTGR